MTLIRYFAIQLLAYGIDLGLFLSVLNLGLFEPLAANVLAKLASGFFCFIVHRNFTFRVANSSSIRHQAFRYFVLLALNIPLTAAIFALLLACIAEPATIKFISDVVCVAMTCELNKQFVFTGQPVVAKFVADILCVALSYGLSRQFVFTGQQRQIKKHKKSSTGVGI